MEDSKREDTELQKTTPLPARRPEVPKTLLVSEAPLSLWERPIFWCIESYDSLIAFRGKFFRAFAIFRGQFFDFFAGSRRFLKIFAFFAYMAAIAAVLFFALKAFDDYESDVFNSGFLEGRRSMWSCKEGAVAFVVNGEIRCMLPRAESVSTKPPSLENVSRETK